MTQDTMTKLKNGGYGAVIGAVIVMVIGFNWGGWVTASTAKELSEEAVLESVASICVAQFSNAKDHPAKLKLFKETEAWERHRLVETEGWDKMPGEEDARIYVSQACARGIEEKLEN